MKKSRSNIKNISKQSESFKECKKQTVLKESRSPSKVSHLGFKIVKKPRSNIKRSIHTQCSVIHFKDYHAPEICNEERKKDSYESYDKIDESYDLTQSISDFIIPGDIPTDILNLDSSSAFVGQIFSEFSDVRSSPSKTFDHEKNNKCFELYDFTKSITDLIIPGDIPDMKSLMLENINSLSNFFMNI